MEETATGSAASPTEAARGTVEIVEPTQAQLAFARGVAESKATAPHAYLRAEIEMGRCAELAVGDPDSAPRIGDMIVRASALALVDCPLVNAAYRDGRFELYSRINVGVTLAELQPPVVPVVRDADQKDLVGIASELRALEQRARAGEITRPELSGGTFTVTDLGGHGISAHAPIIRTGQAATLGTGTVAGGRLVATLSCDQRILQGTEGAEFLRRLRELLEDPDGL